MKKLHLKIFFWIALGALPFAVVYTYLGDQAIYQNSPHLSTVWNKTNPILFIEQNSPLQQNFRVLREGLDRVDVRLQTGAGKYKWSIKKDPLSKESIEDGNFIGNEFQNYDFVSFKFTNSLDEYIGQELWLSIERIDGSLEQGVAAFKSLDNSIVFQVYYRSK